MKILSFLLLALLATVTPAHATAITKDVANAYYQNCTAAQDPHMTQESQSALCACTAAKMQATMSVEDIQTMGRNDEQGRAMLNHMLTEVYGPCMQYPVQDLVSAQCMKDPKIDMMNLKTDRGQLCGCMAENTGQWFSTKGKDLIARLLLANPNMTDPVNPVMDSADFKRASYDSLVSCLNQ